MALASAEILKEGPTVRIPGKDRPGIPSWKRVMEPESIVPVAEAVRERVPAMEALKSVGVDVDSIRCNPEI